MIDLHTHTINSDGSQTTIELLKEAEKKGMNYLSITDHNSIRAYKDIKKINLKEYYTGEIINGVEITTHYKGELIEVLGYLFDLDKMENGIQKHDMYTSFKERYKTRFKLIKDEYAKRGITFEYDLEDENNDMRDKSIHAEIIKHSENDKFFLDINHKQTSVSFFRNEVNNPNSKFYIDQTVFFPNLKTVIDLIHESEGLAFLAHPFIYSKNIVAELENIIGNYSLDGIECFYTTFTEDQTKYLLEIAKKYDLLISGGSDYHGIMKKDHFLGGFCDDNRAVYECFLEWLRI
ncbi:MAG: PHP domain-containing protein [Candidatus Dojkabacteria bacterium]|jgi:predicted metal-dependent phosphoesterase TrpH